MLRAFRRYLIGRLECRRSSARELLNLSSAYPILRTLKLSRIHASGIRIALLSSTQMKFLVSALAALLVLAIHSPSALAGFSTVIIDPGHGGHDRGGILGQRVAEKTVVLDIGRRLRN